MEQTGGVADGSLGALPTEERAVSRRRFLQVAGTLALGAASTSVLGACSSGSSSSSGITGSASVGASGTRGATGQVSAQAPSQEASTSTPHKLSYITPFGFLVGFAPVLLAKQAGFFDKHGVDATIIGGSGSAQPVQQVLAGRVQVARSGGVDLIRAVGAQGAPIVAIGTISQTSSNNLVSARSKPIKGPADMPGKTIGLISTGGNSEITLNMMLAQAGVDRSAVKTQVVGNAPSNFQLIQEGRIDAFMCSIDSVVALQATDAALFYFNCDKYAPSPGQVYFVEQSYLSKDPDAVRGFLAAVREAVEFILAPGGVDKTIEKIGNYPIAALKTPDIAKAGLKAQSELWTSQGSENILRNVPELWNQAQDLMVKAGSIKTKIADSKLYTNDYV